MSITSVPKYPEMTRTVSPIVSNNSTSIRDIPMDSNTGTSKPVVPITSDTGTSKPVFPITSDTGTSKPVFPITSDTGTSKPVFPITSDTGTSKPVFPITSDTGTSKPIVPMASSTDNSACNSSSTSRKRHRVYDDFVENCSKKIYEVVNDNILNAFGQFQRQIYLQAEAIQDLTRRFDSQTEYMLELESGLSEHRFEILGLKGSVQSLEAENAELHHLVDVLEAETVQLRQAQEQAEDATNIVCLEGRTQAAVLRQTIATLHEVESKLASN